MKNMFVLLIVVSILSAPYAIAEPFELEVGKNVCGLVKKMTNRHEIGGSYLVVDLDVSGTLKPYFIPVSSSDMSIVTSAFLSGRRFCASLNKDSFGGLKHTYSVGE